MHRAFLATILLATVAVAKPVCAKQEARVVLAAASGTVPAAEAVREILQDHLNRLEVRVDVVELDAPRFERASWVSLSKELYAKRPGTLAVFGWSCREAGECDLYVVEPESDAFCVIPVRPREVEDGAQPEDALAIAATAREAVWGGLLLEMKRLEREGASPAAPPEDPIGAPAQYQPVATVANGSLGRRRLLWLEGGYAGNYAHPQGDPVHGPWLALAVSPARFLVTALSVGWLGVAVGEDDSGKITTNRIPLELQLRLALPVGFSTLSFAAVGRMDVVFAGKDIAGPGGESSRTDLEADVGGVAIWKFPLPGDKLEASMGAGVLLTVKSRGYAVDDEDLIPASRFRLVWSLGVSWNLI